MPGEIPFPERHSKKTKFGTEKSLHKSPQVGSLPICRKINNWLNGELNYQLPITIVLAYGQSKVKLWFNFCKEKRYV